MKRQAYLDRLDAESESLHLAYLTEFSADHVDYQWLSAEQVDGQRLLSSSQAAVTDAYKRAVAKSAWAHPVPPPPHAASVFLDEHLLIPITDKTERRIFMFISKYDEYEQKFGTRLHDEILLAVQKVGITDASLYRGDGEGFCDFVLKGYLPKNNILSDVTRLQEALSDLGQVGWTLSPIGVDPIGDYESIDAAVSSEGDTLAQLINSSTDQYVATDTLRERMQLSQNVSAVLKTLEAVGKDLAQRSDIDASNRVRRRVQSILAGLLSESRKRVNRELSFLVSIPSDLREILELLDSNGATGFWKLPELGTIRQLCDVLIFILEANPALARPVPLESESLQICASAADGTRDEFFTGELLAECYGEILPAQISENLMPIAQAALLQIFFEELRTELLNNIANSVINDD